MKPSLAATALLGSLLSAAVMAQLAEYGIEGMGVVSTPASEVRATVRPDGQHIVWGSPDRSGGDVPPLLSSTAIWSPILNEKEIGLEEALYRRANHWLPA